MNEYEKNKLNRVKRGANRAIYDTKTINSILDAGFIGHVGYNYDGYPISIPMAYARKDGKVYLHGSTANRMLLSILEAGKTAITVMHLDALVLARSGFHHSVNYRSATLFGRVQKVENDNKKTEYLELIIEQMIKGRWNELRAMTKKELDRSLVVEFTIENASAKIRDAEVIDEPEDQNLPIWAGLIPIQQIANPPISDRKLPKGVIIPEHVLEYCTNIHK